VQADKPKVAGLVHAVLIVEVQPHAISRVIPLRLERFVGGLDFFGSASDLTATPGSFSPGTDEYINVQSTIGTIVVTGAGSANAALEIYNGSGTDLDQIKLSDIQGSWQYADFTSDPGTLGGEDIYLSNVVCFAAGTRIPTPAARAGGWPTGEGYLCHVVARCGGFRRRGQSGPPACCTPGARDPRRVRIERSRIRRRQAQIKKARFGLHLVSVGFEIVRITIEPFTRKIQQVSCRTSRRIAGGGRHAHIDV
jgi:hypothetical protein